MLHAAASRISAQGSKFQDLTLTLLPAVASTAYNAANHQTTFGNKTLTYDNNGNLQTITDLSGTTTYTWNARNQLTGISGPTINASFVYDGMGRREEENDQWKFDGVSL